MKPVPVKQRNSVPVNPPLTLDDAEMTLTLIGLGDEMSITDGRQSPVRPVLTYDVQEFASAASMILDKEEREALAKELAEALRPHHVAA